MPKTWKKMEQKRKEETKKAQEQVRREFRGSEKSMMANEQAKEIAAFVFGHWEVINSLAVK